MPQLLRNKFVLGLLLGVLALMPRQASAQGCILTRNTSPVLGAQISPYLQKGEWQVGANYRQFTADTQYQRTGLSEPVTSLRTNVISKMRYIDFSGTYGLTPQWNLTFDVPFMFASSNRALPSNVAGSTRYVQSSTGFGDVLVGARYWFLDCDSNPDRNISLGFGLKTPTGDSEVHDLFPNAQGLDVRERVVDQSIQLGDGGWGFYLASEIFWQIQKFTVFGSGIYVFNPRTQNDTFSPPAMLNPVGPSAVDSRFRYNTVSDSYLLRGGVGFPFPGGIPAALSAAMRIEGVPVHDVFGATGGFRRPGYYLTFEPGINYSQGKTTIALSTPLRLHQNVKDDQYGIRRDSTFADHMILMSITYRFGGAAVESPAGAP
ncbi:MAG TPA: hypothetical protein VNN17_01740 [Terriglobia bacterium]|nr:hypothetical protein [Terriglobia bacterium]